MIASAHTPRLSTRTPTVAVRPPALRPGPLRKWSGRSSTTPSTASCPPPAPKPSRRAAVAPRRSGREGKPRAGGDRQRQPVERDGVLRLPAAGRGGGQTAAGRGLHNAKAARFLAGLRRGGRALTHGSGTARQIARRSMARSSSGIAGQAVVHRGVHPTADGRQAADELVDGAVEEHDEAGRFGSDNGRHPRIAGSISRPLSADTRRPTSARRARS
jgi:hypothetical protein